MPLLTSPIDGSPMRQIHRFGIELDVCPASGGVWLDKGELEKLMHLMKEAAEEEARLFSGHTQRVERYDEPHYQDSDYRKPHYKERGSNNYKGKHKKKGAIHQMMEIFDF